MTALGYVRRSQPSRYAWDGRERVVSLDEQRARIEAYCAAQGWTLVGVVTDDGVSGGKRVRLVRLTGLFSGPSFDVSRVVPVEGQPVPRLRGQVRKLYQTDARRVELLVYYYGPMPWAGVLRRP
jgi:hypothetical protein